MRHEVEGHVGATKDTAYALSDYTRRLLGKAKDPFEGVFCCVRGASDVVTDSAKQAALELV